MSKPKILVIGATGGIGVYLTPYIKETLGEKFEIIAVARRKTDYFDRYGIQYYSLDITNKADFNKLPTENVHSVILLAGILPAQMVEYDPSEYVEINIGGTLNVLEYCRRVCADRIVFTKSWSDLQGYLPDTTFLKADMPVKFDYDNDHSVYAISKVCAEELINQYHVAYGLKNFILRLPNIYLYSPVKTYRVKGEETFVGYRYMIDRAIQGLPIEMWGDPSKGVDAVYIKDFDQIVRRCIETDADGGVFNIGSGRITSMKEQIEGMIEVFSSSDNKSKIVPCPEKKDCVNVLMDISITKQVLGYEPEYDYTDYLKDYKEEMASDRFEGLYE